jgi:hypothetical protein
LSRGGWFGQPQIRVSRSAIRLTSPSVWSMKDALPLVPLDEKTKCPAASSRSIQSSTSFTPSTSTPDIEVADTVSNHIVSRSHRPLSTNEAG